MKTLTTWLIGVITITNVINSALAQNVIFNGSFEQPGPAGTINSYAHFPAGSAAIPGWITILNGVEYADISQANVGTKYAYRGVAQDGSFCVDLAPLTFVGGGIEQVLTTTPGANYEISFYLGTMAFDGRDGTAHCVVSAGDSTNSFELTNVGDFARWETRSFSFTAASSTTTLTFSTADDPLRHFVLIDNVTVFAFGSPLNLELGFYPGIRINGRIGKSYVVEYAETINGSNWRPFAYVTLNASSQFVFDLASPNRTNRFYRATEIP